MMGRSCFVASVVLMVAASWLPACGGPQQGIAKAPTVEGTEEGQSTCKVAKDPLNPLIVEWPGTSKVSLDSASRQGVVVVSYVGCVLKVLGSCQAGGSYDLKPVTPVRDKVSIESETDLYARLPLGVASLKGELKTGQRLELEYVAVGQRETAKPPVSLSGECEGATHYVRSIMVGAYGLDAVGTGMANAGVAVGENGGGVQRTEAVRHIRGSGDVAKCAAADKSSDCGAVLQLGLAPLSASGGAVTSGGFGAGLGALTVVPTVREVTTLAGGATSLAKADVALLTVLQEAKRADKAAVPFEQKAAAWAKLAAYAGDNPYKELADKRSEEWTRAAEAETRRKEQVVRVCRQHAADSSKLAELLRLDDEVVSAKQKAAYRAELAQVYGPYAQALEECKRDAEARRIAALPLLCGRYQLVDPGNGVQGSGTGLVRDNKTGLTWARFRSEGGKDQDAASAYCSQKQMRLPTKGEVESIAGSSRCAEAWPEGWHTWTSTPAGAGRAWNVELDGNTLDSGVRSRSDAALCVRWAGWSFAF